MKLKIKGKDAGFEIEPWHFVLGISAWLILVIALGVKLGFAFAGIGK